MTAGLKRLSKVQLGLESASGTPVAATTHWRGTGKLVDNLEVGYPEEDVGQMLGMTRSYIKKKGAAFTLDEIEATFEQLPYSLSACLANVVSGTKDGSGSGYVYTYPFPTTARPTFRTYTLRGGDDQGAEIVEYAFCEKFSITGEGENAVMMSSDWIGRQATPGAFTNSISFPTVEEVLFGNAKLYINAPSTYPATSQMTSTFVKFEFTGEDLLAPVYTGDGNGQVFTFAKPKEPKLSLAVTFEHDSQAIAEKAAWRAGTERAVRIILTGTALTTPTATHATKKLIIDAVGTWEKFSGIEDQDGNNQVTGTLNIRYSATAGAAGQVVIVNQLSALP